MVRDLHDDGLGPAERLRGSAIQARLYCSAGFDTMHTLVFFLLLVGTGRDWERGRVDWEELGRTGH